MEDRKKETSRMEDVNITRYVVINRYNSIIWEGAVTTLNWRLTL
jgi:hypothetical protein